MNFYCESESQENQEHTDLLVKMKEIQEQINIKLMYNMMPLFWLPGILRSRQSRVMQDKTRENRSRTRSYKKNLMESLISLLSVICESISQMDDA